MRKAFLTLLSIFISIYGYSQNNWSVRTNGGYASSSNSNGYYFSFDIGIPIIKSIELAPTFTYSSRLPNNKINDAWLQSNGNYGLTSGDQNSTIENGENSGSISLLAIFKPFDLIKSDRLKRHELMVGAGYSWCSYTKFFNQYTINGNQFEPVGIQISSVRRFEPYYFKLGYNYLFRENLLSGIVISANGFDGASEVLVGLQFGVKF